MIFQQYDILTVYYLILFLCLRKFKLEILQAFKLNFNYISLQSKNNNTNV